jgi:hypothetical protein
MADRPRDDDWWLASDGKWYPADIGPGDSLPQAPTARRAASDISRSFTVVVEVALAVASVVLVAASVAGFGYASALQKFSGVLSDAENGSLESVELTWAGWTGLALLLLVATGLLVMAWTYTTSRALDARGPIGRRWRGAWTVGAWLIPFANLVLPKLVFDEIEKIAQVPYGNVPVGDAWRDYSRFQLGDLWWLLWIGGVIPSQITQILLGDPGSDAGRLAILVSISSFTYALFAGAGVALVFLIRRVERSSRA